MQYQYNYFILNHGTGQTFDIIIGLFILQWVRFPLIYVHLKTYIYIYIYIYIIQFNIHFTHQTIFN